MGEELNEEQQAAKDAREAATDEILADSSDKKVVIAGPGTGKTFLFGQVFASIEAGNKLTLTFINALVEDLALELRGISDVKTLHGYALGCLAEHDVKIFPPLPHVIREDGKFLLDADIDFQTKIYNIDESDGYLDFYSTRRQYYGHFGYADIVLGLVRWFEQDTDRIPTYSQVVVDEFQDFNKLEVTLIELLATKSPIVIAGDDDQALYDFKKASPDHIRELHGDDRPEFASFPLPYCSRSTQVIVESVNDIVAKAQERGFLKGRVEKRYDYFPCPEKDAESAAETQLVHKQLQDAQIAWFVADQMGDIAETTRKKFEILVISPYTAQCQKIGNALSGKGFSKVEIKTRSDNTLSYFDGLRLLTRVRTGYRSNLGWRIASSFKLDPDVFGELVHASSAEEPPVFRSLVPMDVRGAIERDVDILKRVKENQPVEENELNDLLTSVEFDQMEIKSDYVRGQLSSGGQPEPGYAGIRKLPITTTTIQSSKGLSADYVFITHFDQRYLPGDNGLSDRSICDVLVALTRARKKVWLLSTTDEPCEILDWIATDRINRQ